MAAIGGSLEPLVIAKSKEDIAVLPAMANRHGMIAGATGTGKTVSLRLLAEQLSNAGVPVFMADVKGDLSGIAMPSEINPKIRERVDLLGITGYEPAAFPVTFWDVYGETGHPVRTTVSEMGPLLFSRLLNLNETQAGVLMIIFKIADDDGLLLLDLKDLRAMIQFVGDNASQFQTGYGNISTASIGAIQRNLLALEQEGADRLFGEPAMNLDDFIQTDVRGRGMVNILAAEKLMQSPQLYSTFLLWLLSELFEELPEVGDPEKPRLVFFFDEAHLLFSEAPRVLLQKIEQVVRLIRSKGVGVYFISQNPLDIPDVVLGQLGNRIQHALRAFTPRDQKAVRAAAETFRANPEVNVEEAITQLGVGEALVSLLDERGQPGIVQRAWIYPPRSRMQPLNDSERKVVIEKSILYGHYENLKDRESAYEILLEKARKATETKEQTTTAMRREPVQVPREQRHPAGRKTESLFDAMAKSTARAVGSSLGRQIIRGVLGGILGKKRW